MSKQANDQANNTTANNAAITAPSFMVGTMKAEIENEMRRALTAMGCDTPKTVSTEQYYRMLAIAIVRVAVPADLISDPTIRAAYVARTQIVLEALPKNASACRQAVYVAKKEKTTTGNAYLDAI